MAIESHGIAPETVFFAEELAKLDKVKARFEKTKDIIAPQEADDEFHEQSGLTVLSPLKKIEMSNDARLEASINKNLENEFVYLSKTRKLEVNTARTQTLQQIVDRMTADSGIETRVVIMQKGQTSDAFVTPDGTIFVSQSLINQLHFDDELAGGLAHELGHLIFKTYIHSLDPAGSKFAVNWVHEEACDLYAPRLLEKSGYNSLAFASAIEKIQGVHRGTYHQSGLARASQSYSAHFGVNYTTSDVSLTSLADNLKGKVEKTNLEIAYEELKKPVASKFEQIIKKLHPYDLEEVRKELKVGSYKEATAKAIRKVNKLIDERLTEAGLSEPARKLFMICLREKNSLSKVELDYFEKPQDLIDIVSELDRFENSDISRQMYQIVFAREYGFGFKFNHYPIRIVTELMSNYIYDQDFERRNGIPVTREDLLHASEILSKTGGEFHPVGVKDPVLTQVFMRYLQRTFLKLSAEAGTDLDPIQMTEFFQEIKDRQIALDPNYLIGLINIERYTHIWEAGKDLKFSQRNRNIVAESIKKVFELEDKNAGYKEIDEFFTLLTNPELKDVTMVKNFNNLIKLLQASFSKQDFEDSQRVEYLDYIFQKIGQSNLNSQVLLSEYLKGSSYPYQDSYHPAPEGSNALIPEIMKFNLRLLCGLTLFKRDGDEFYQYMSKSMLESGLNVDQLSRIELINLCAPMLWLESQFQQFVFLGKNSIGETDFFNTIGIKNYPAFFAMPFIKSLIEKQEQSEFSNIGQLLDEYTNDFVNKFHQLRDSLAGKNYLDTNLLFGNSVISLIAGGEIQRSFAQILTQGIPESDFGDLYTFINNFFPKSTQKESYLKELNKRYLQSAEVSFDQKVDYLLNNFNRVGAEGAAILAEQIEDIETFRSFMQKLQSRLETYLDGGSITEFISRGDFVSSYFTQHFGSLLKTADPSPESQRFVSTELAQEWLQQAVFAFRMPESGLIRFDKQARKFELDSLTRPIFRTLTDSFDYFKNLSHLQRFAIAHKALTDQNGALTSSANREILSKILIKSLGVKDRFVSTALSLATKQADAKLIGFPVSNMLAPLFFRAFNVEAINYEQLSKEKVYDSRNTYNEREGALTGWESVPLGNIFSQEELRYYLESDTRTVTLFGAHFLDNPDSWAAHQVTESDNLYFSINEKLSRLLAIRQENYLQNEEIQSALDPASESIIRGIETSGALGIRSLQLSSQFLHFNNPEVGKRFSQSFDSNPGMINKLVFWYNIDKLARENLANGNPAIEDFVQKVRVRERLGAGSLQTTYAGVLINESGQERPIVLKQRNPNVIRFIGEVYNNAQKVLEQTGRSLDPRTRNLAQTGLALIDLARKWCLDDLNDHSFIQDDDKFRQVVDRFNKSLGNQNFSAPERVFTDISLKSESLATGRTVNQILNDESVSQQTKQTIVGNIGKFFKFQMSRENMTVDEQGKQVVIVHSDPHVGNYVVDTNSPEPKIAVIDRSMFLKLEEADLAVLDKLTGNENDNDFIYGFIDRVLDLNKVKGIGRMAVTGRVLAKVAAEYSTQRIRGNVDRFGLMRTMLMELSNTKMDVPLNLRLMVRNIAAMQELMKRYNLDLSTT